MPVGIGNEVRYWPHEICDGGWTPVLVNKNKGVIIGWNESATFNVYEERFDAGKTAGWAPVDCFTHYPEGWMEGRTEHATIEWAEKIASDWYRNRGL